MVSMKKIGIAAVIVLAGVGFSYWKYEQAQAWKHMKFTSGNGRMEATEIYISALLGERIEKIYAEEGDLVKEGDVLVQMRTNTLEVKLKQAQAQIQVRASEVEVAKSLIAQKYSLYDAAEKRYKRTKELHDQGVLSDQLLEDDESGYLASKANYEASKASLSEAEAALEAAKADAQVIEEDIKDSTLYSPRRGRIQYHLSEIGEVMPAGGRVLNLVDLTDVYMTFYLPERFAGQVQMGSEVRIVLDAMPDYPIPATVSYVASVAQFTPKTVETEEERQKLMFRIKARIEPELLEKCIDYVKTGLPGVAWVKLDNSVAWPENLKTAVERGIIKAEDIGKGNAASTMRNE